MSGVLVAAAGARNTATITVTIGHGTAGAETQDGFTSAAWATAFGGGLSATGSNSAGPTSFKSATIGTLARLTDGLGGDLFIAYLLGNLAAGFVTGFRIEDGAGGFSYKPAIKGIVANGYTSFYFDATSWTNKWASGDSGEQRTVTLLG